MDRAVYKFRSGAIDAIARLNQIDSDEELASYLGVRLSDLPAIRAGAPVSSKVALYVSSKQGDLDYLGVWFDEAYPRKRAVA